MHINETNDIWDVAVEEQLQFTDREIEEVDPSLRGDAEQRPVITIGKPNLWLLDLKQTQLGQPLGNSTFLLVRFAFSLRVYKSPIDTVSFTVNCHSDVGSPTAFDMFPRNETKEQRSSITLSISPELQFLETVKASVGKIETTIENVKVIPIVEALGIGESSPYWILKHHPQYPLRGTRITYMVIEKPEQAKSAFFTLDAEAQVKTKAGLFRTRLEVERDKLTWEL